jgi:hypothetical protein
LLIVLASPFLADAKAADSPPAKHWAFQPIRAPSIPVVKDASWPKSDLDRFVLAKLEAAGLKPAPPADRRTLIRRATFDVIGLPPTPEEIDAFVKDESSDAFAKVVERLLANPGYGERWGRHWLDVARYADSNGFEYDEIRPDAWRYRDYVIAAFNADMPYTRFIREQLAGDELSPDVPSALIATGFNLLGPDMTDSSDQVQRRQNTLNDMTDTAGLAFLGLTIGCARCHDHKFEPLTQVDYYRLQAFFTPTKFRKDVNIVPKERRAALAAAVAAYESKRKPIQAALDELEGPSRSELRNSKLAKQAEEVREAHETPEEKRTPAQRERVAETERFVSVSQGEVLKKLNAEQKSLHKELLAKLKTIDAGKPNVPIALGLEDDAKPEKTFVLERGEPSSKGDEVQPGFPVVLTKEAPKIAAPRPTTTGRRTALANWLTDERNPLTARVMVNRLWHHHFGRGIVRTPSDFGVRGLPPTHPELLDWLAAKFMQDGWSLKSMHKLMLTSATYQQSTTASAEAMKADRENLLFSRMNRRRLEGETVRDSLLAISGRLDPNRGVPSAAKREDHRRSVYLLARRNLRNPFLEAFDLPDSNLSCPKRECSTTASQALTLLNDAEVAAAAKALAAKLSKEPDPVTAVYLRALGRKPSETEGRTAKEFLKDSPLSEFCRAVFNVNEFVYLD